MQIAKRVGLTSLLFLLCFVLAVFVSPAWAQAPAADPYEPNDSLNAASSVPKVITLPNMTIYPAGDVDFWRVLAVPGPLTVQAIATPGLDLTLRLYEPSGAVISESNDPTGPNASLAISVTAEGYYIVEVRSETVLEGFYELRIYNATPTATPLPTSTLTPTSTPTLVPTATSPFPTSTPTPDLGGVPDFAEPNYNVATAFRIAPGDQLKGLNFNSGVPGQVDNDFFVMAVRQGIQYTCLTEDLGPNVDTNLIVYYSANTNDVAGGNDDEDTQSGKINSRLTFTARAEGDVYILAGYKYPITEDLRYPGAATYALSCTATSPTPTPTAVPAGSGNGGTATPAHPTPVSIQILQTPDRSPTATAQPIGMLTVDVLVAYDLNANHEAEPAEGVAGLSIRVLDPLTNRELAQGITDATGAARLIVPTNGSISVAIPFLSAVQDFRPGSPASWKLIIPAVNAPGLIP